MPVFTIGAPDGRKIKIEAGDEATALRGAQEWAAANPAAKAPNMNVQQRFDALPKTDVGRPDLINSTAATVNGLVAAVPGLQTASDAILSTGGMLLGKDFNQSMQVLKLKRDEIARSAPLARATGEITGNIVAPMAALGPLGVTGSLGSRLLNSSASMAGYEGLKSLGEGNTGGEVLQDMGVGGVGGAAGATVGKVVEKVGSGLAKAVTGNAQTKATTAAIQNAPGADELAAASRASFKAVDDAGVTIKTDRFAELVRTLTSKAKADRINPDLDQKAFPAYRELIGALEDVQRNGGSLTISDLHTLRQIAQKAAVSTEGRDAMFANRIVDALDEFVVSPGVVAFPSNRLGSAQAGGNELLKAISTWGRARRVGMIEEAMFKAQNAASGPANGLKVEFRKLLQNPKTRRMFSAPEIQAIEKVVNGDALSNAAKLAGMFGFNFGPGSANFVGGSVGLLFGGPLGALLATGARKVSDKLASGAAERAAKVVATPNIPIVPPAPNRLLPMRQPLEILVRGSAPALVSTDR